MDPNRQLFGTEINEERVKFSNQILNENIVRIDFKNGLLLSFKDSNVDNVVCSEVLEHIQDNNIALKELCRVSKTRIIISVPYNEEIFQHHCIHCWKYTPSYGHIHSYKLNTFDNFIPKGWHISNRGTFGNIISKFLVRKIDVYLLISIVEQLSSKLFPNMNSWMYIVLEKDKP